MAEEYENLWNFPHCVGALDGKHIELQAPFKNGSEYCKGTCSIILLGAVNATNSFLFASVGCQHRTPDGEVMVDQHLAKKLYDGTLNLPPPVALSGQENPTPYVFVCNDAFPLKENMMKPFPGTHVKGSLKGTYNYRLSKPQCCGKYIRYYGICFSHLEETSPSATNKSKKCGSCMCPFA